MEDWKARRAVSLRGMFFPGQHSFNQENWRFFVLCKVQSVYGEKVIEMFWKCYSCGKQFNGNRQRAFLPRKLYDGTVSKTDLCKSCYLQKLKEGRESDREKRVKERMDDMKVLIACEFSGIVRDAFIKRGHDAVSCDILPTEKEGPHIQGNVLEHLNENWSLMIAHPPCQYLTIAGIHWNNRLPGRREKTEEALEFVKQLLNAPVPRIALENPIGVISTRIRKPDQIIQPWQFGHPESKRTGLWLKNLPKLIPTDILIPSKFQTNGLPRWDNQTPTGQNKLGPSPNRWKDRSRTYQGIADAMAEQWGDFRPEGGIG